MALEEGLVDRDRLDRADTRFRIEAFDPVDQQHRIAMRQRRHHPLDVERSDGGAGRSLVHRPCGVAGCAGAVVWTLGKAVLSAVSTSLVTSSAAPEASVVPSSTITLAPRRCITCW